MTSLVRDAIAVVKTRFPTSTVVERGRGYVLHEIVPGVKAWHAAAGNAGYHFGDGPYTEANEIVTDWVDNVGTPNGYFKKMELADYHAYAGLAPEIYFDDRVIRYQDPSTSEYVTFEPNALNWRVRTADSETFDQIGAAQHIAGALSADTITWTNAFGPGLHVKWQNQVTRLAKVLKVDNLTDLGVPPEWMFGPPWDTGTIYAEISMFFSRSANVRAYVDGVLFGEKNKEEKTTANNIEFRHVTTGEVLWYFRAPLAWDSAEKPSQIIAQMRVKATAQGLAIEIQVPWAWLETAVYPVFIDPTTNPAVGQSSDDAGEYNGPVALTQVQIAVDAAVEYGGCRWPVPAGVHQCTVNNSYFYVSVPAGGDEPQHRFHFQKTGANPGTFTSTDYDISGRTRTTAYFDWDVADLGAPGWFSTGTNSLNTAAQEVIDTYDFSSGGYLVLIWYSIGPANRDLVIDTYDGSSPPQFYMEYTEASSGVNVNLDTAALAASGPSLSTVPGAVSKALGTASVTATGPSLSIVPGAVGISLDTAQLVAAGLTAGIIPGTASIALDTALLTAQGVNISIGAGGAPVSLPLDTAMLTASGQALSLAPGEATVPLSTATVSLSSQLTVSPGEASINLGTASLVAASQMSVSPGEASIALNTGQLTTASQLGVAPGPIAIPLVTSQIQATSTLAVEPGGVSVALDTATATLSSAITIGSVTIISLNTAALVASSVLGVTPGTVSISLDTAALTATGQATSIGAGTAIQLQTAQLTAASQSTVIPGAAITTLNTAQLTAASQASLLPGPYSLVLDSASLSASSQLSVSTGAVAVDLATAALVASGQILSVVSEAGIQLQTAQLSASSQLSVVPGEATISLATAVLAVQGQAISLNAEQDISLSTASLVAAGQSLAVVPGEAQITLSTADLVSQSQLTVDPGPANVSLASAILQTDSQIVVVPGAVSVSLDSAVLLTDGLALNVVPGTASVDLLTAQLFASGPVIVVNPNEGSTLEILDLALALNAAAAYRLYIDRARNYEFEIDTARAWEMER